MERGNERNMERKEQDGGGCETEEKNTEEWGIQEKKKEQREREGKEGLNPVAKVTVAIGP